MANMELITSVTVGSGGAASVTLPATGTIPQTYTDLKIVASARSSFSNPTVSFKVTVSGATSYSTKYLQGDGSSAASGSNAYGTSVFYAGEFPAGQTTASTFGNTEIYIPNYTSTTNKSASIDSVTENNGTTAYATLIAALINTSSAITTITITPSSGDFASGSTFYLYGISNVTSGSKATGGIVSSDGSYFYHTFLSSGTFTPTTTINTDILCVAGGGGGGRTGGGGGAGGLRQFTSQSLTAQAYTITVGSGGAGNNVDGQKASNGTNSSIVGTGLSIASTGGGGAASYGGGTGLSGGSGGGGAGISNAGGSGNAGSYSPVEGYAGGTGGSGVDQGGGGGGAGAVGGNGNSGKGGIGATSALINAMAIATSTGDSGYYAGGGGAAQNQVGGLGGGGRANPDGNGIAGFSNTGGGGGAGGGNSPAGAAGGSGIVIIRYAI